MATMEWLTTVNAVVANLGSKQYKNASLNNDTLTL